MILSLAAWAFALFAFLAFVGFSLRFGWYLAGLIF